MKKRQILISLLFLFSIVGFAESATINVPANYPTIQEAINASVDGDEIVVADDVYTGVNNRNLDFAAGLPFGDTRAITVRSANGPENCIIDCQGLGRAFFFYSGETGNSIVEGFTIRNGFDLDYGGAIECISIFGAPITTDPTISNCIIYDCLASTYDGGAIDCYNSEPNIIDCIIYNNEAGADDGRGGGIECYNSTPAIINCLIYGNTAGRYGGAIDCYNSSPIITNCTIVDNSTTYNSSGVYANGSSSPLMTNCIVWGNGDDVAGAAMATYSCIEDGDFGLGNISDDPMFRTGPLGDYYLTQPPCQLAGNNCVDGGSGSLAELTFWGSNGYTTRTDSGADSSTIDMGYNYPDSGPATQYQLTTSVVGGNGSIDPSAGVHDISEFNEVLLTALPDTGFGVRQWLGTDDDSSLEMTNAVTMTGNKSVSVEYRSLVVYELTTIVIDDHGSITVSPPSIDPGIEYLYYEDESVQLTAVPDTGYVLRAWTGTENDSSISTNNTVIMDANKTVTAEFIPDTTMFHLNARVVGGNGDVSPRRGDYLVTTVVPLVATPDAHYRVKAWTGTDDDTSTSNNNAVTMVADIDVTVEFELSPQYWLETLAVSDGEIVPGGILPSSGLVYDGTVVLVTASPGPGLVVKRWHGTNNDASTANTNAVTINGSDAYVIVEFQPSGASMPAGTIKIEGESTIYTNIQAAIDATPFASAAPDPCDPNIMIPPDVIPASVVIVADGVYSGTGNYDLNLKNGLDPIDDYRILTVRSLNGPQDCIIDCNGLGRGFIFDANEDPNYVVDGFTITWGVAGDGGAIYCGADTSPVITNCKIINNSTNLTYQDNGGGIYCINASPIIINTEISYNRAWNGGGIYCLGESTPEIINCLFTYNHSLDAGGSIYLYDSDPEIHLCTVAYNSSELYYDPIDGVLGGIFCREADPAISNCIIWGNGDDLYGCDATYSCIEDGDGGTGNIADNPLFVTGSFGDFYLSQVILAPTLVSPCVDAGEQYILLDLQADYALGYDITTAIINLYDGGYADMGYHYRFNYGPPIRYKLKTFVDGGNGHIWPDPLPVVHYHDPGTIVSLLATADPCYRVYQWTGTDNDFQYSDFSTATMYSDMTVSVEFELIQPRTLIVSVGGGEPGYYVDISDAIHDARTADTIVVHAGTYYGATIQVDKSIEIRSLHPDDPNYVAATIIDRLGYNEIAFIFGYGADANTILNGFTIQNCGGRAYDGRDGARGSPRFHPNGEDGGWAAGGAIIIQAYAAPVIKNCIIKDNYIEGGPAGDGVNATSTANAGRGGWGGGVFGGAIYCDFGSSPTFINCRILDNLARGGDGGDGGDWNITGGMANYGGNWSRAEFVYYDPDSLGAIPVDGDLYTVFQSDGLGYSLLWDFYTFFDPYDPNTWEPGTWEYPSGYVRDYRWYSAYGGGVFCNGRSNVTFEDCVISGNRTYGGMSGIGGLAAGHRFEPGFSYELQTFGAGVYCAANSRVTFTGCTLTDNIASPVQLVDPNDPNSGTRYRQESYIGHGGGICAENTATVIITDCNFSENAASVGGAIQFADANAVISDCNFSSNTAYHGGALAGHQGEGIIIGCELRNNRAAIDVDDIGLVYGQGGGLYLWDANVGVFDCDISNNEAEASGAGVYIGGESGPLLSNCLITNNMCGRDGGGVSANIFAWPMLFNCTIANNVVTGDGFTNYYGGGLYCYDDSNTTVINSILWGNIAFNGRQIAVGTGESGPSVVNVSFSDIQGGGAYVAAPATGGDTWVDETCTLVWDEASNLSGTSASEPDFASGYFGNYYLSHIATGAPNQSTDSPCIDLGDGEANSLVLGPYRYTTRTDNGDDDPNIDIGFHYYKSGKFSVGDINYDGEINEDDLNILISYWLSECSFPDWCEGSDLNRDGIVNFIDQAILAALYGAGDVEPPVPDASTWRLPPHSTAATVIEMAATEAADNSGGPVEYYFECVTNGSFDSGWQDSASYVRNGLTNNNEYGFKVKARDTSPAQNETGWSQIGYAVAGDVVDITPPSPDPMNWLVQPEALSSSSIGMEAVTASDVSGVQYLFEETTGGGNSSGWQDGTVYTDTGLDPNTLYIYRVKARDKSIYWNETGWSIAASIATFQEGVEPNEPNECFDDGSAPQPNPYLDPNLSYMSYDDGNDVYFHLLESSIAEDVNGGCEVEYFFQCYTNTGFNSGWQTSNIYQVDVSHYPVNYYWRVKARDPFRETPWSGFLIPD